MARKKENLNQKIIEATGLHFHTEETRIFAETELGPVLRLLEISPQLLPALKNTHERDIVDPKLWRTGFVGAPRETLMENLGGKIDMARYETAKAELMGTGLFQKLQTQLAAIAPARKRIMSAHDGEWDMGRQWDTTPFYATQRTTSGLAKSVRIVGMMSFSGSTGSGTIDRYGAFLWALSDLIEQAGVSVELVLRCKHRLGVDDKDFHMDVCVKKPGQYIAPTLTAAVCQSAFYRGAFFLAQIAAGEYTGTKVPRGLGRVDQSQHTGLHFSNGVLEVVSGVINQPAEYIEKHVMESLAA
jgi:hypothetical protein